MTEVDRIMNILVSVSVAQGGLDRLVQGEVGLLAVDVLVQNELHTPPAWGDTAGSVVAGHRAAVPPVQTAARERGGDQPEPVPRTRPHTVRIRGHGGGHHGELG